MGDIRGQVAYKIELSIWMGRERILKNMVRAITKLWEGKDVCVGALWCACV